MSKESFSLALNPDEQFPELETAYNPVTAYFKECYRSIDEGAPTWMADDPENVRNLTLIFDHAVIGQVTKVDDEQFIATIQSLLPNNQMHINQFSLTKETAAKDLVEGYITSHVTPGEKIPEAVTPVFNA